MAASASAPAIVEGAALPAGGAEAEERSDRFLNRVRNSNEPGDSRGHVAALRALRDAGQQNVKAADHVADFHVTNETVHMLAADHAHHTQRRHGVSTPAKRHGSAIVREMKQVRRDLNRQCTPREPFLKEARWNQVAVDQAEAAAAALEQRHPHLAALARLAAQPSVDETLGATTLGQESALEQVSLESTLCKAPTLNTSSLQQPVRFLDSVESSGAPVRFLDSVESSGAPGGKGTAALGSTAGSGTYGSGGQTARSERTGTTGGHGHDRGGSRSGGGGDSTVATGSGFGELDEVFQNNELLVHSPPSLMSSPLLPRLSHPSYMGDVSLRPP